MCVRSERPAVIASLSARVGSIGDNSLGGWYSYRASKTALNQVCPGFGARSASQRLQFCWCCTVDYIEHLPCWTGFQITRTSCRQYCEVNASDPVVHQSERHRQRRTMPRRACCTSTVTSWRRTAFRPWTHTLPQLTKTMSVEFARRKQSVASVLLHPGTVDTDLSAPFQKASGPVAAIRHPCSVFAL